MINDFINEVQGISLIDIGSSGNLDVKFSKLTPYIDLVGFDPNEAECLRMASVPSNFRSVKYLPYAIAGDNGSAVLYKTRSMYCYSLLRPNSAWVNRFAFAELFDVVGEESVVTRKLDDIPDVVDSDVDIIKCDTQGLELAILNTAKFSLSKAFLVETETGFVENYIGETTYAQIDEFMRSEGFLLFDLNTNHRVSRNNIFKNIRTGSEQIMWCEALWLKDYGALAKNGSLNAVNFSRRKVLASLIICSLHGCIDYGLEIAELGFEVGQISRFELEALQNQENWKFPTISGSNGERISRSLAGRWSGFIIDAVPLRLRKIFRDQVTKSILRTTPK